MTNAPKMEGDKDVGKTSASEVQTNNRHVVANNMGYAPAEPLRGPFDRKGRGQACPYIPTPSSALDVGKKETRSDFGSSRAELKAALWDPRIRGEQTASVVALQPSWQDGGRRRHTNSHAITASGSGSGTGTWTNDQSSGNHGPKTKLSLGLAALNSTTMMERYVDDFGPGNDLEFHMRIGGDLTARNPGFFLRPAVLQDADLQDAGLRDDDSGFFSS